VKKIKILKNGPYQVSGDIPLFEKEIVMENDVQVLKTIRQLETNGDYYLCRCGHSENIPFCDGHHVKINFDGTETAGFSKYLERAELYQGSTIDLLDDERCAFARFCHKEDGSVWELIENSFDNHRKKEAIEAANNCPAGRLTIVTKDGQLLEPELEPSISYIKDRPKGCGAGLFVTGNIELESANGQTYELRNRYALCRCGASKNKPFCDAMHVGIKFNK
jgi:CDGSH-type Zn-finger protein